MTRGNDNRLGVFLRRGVLRGEKPPARPRPIHRTALVQFRKQFAAGEIRLLREAGTDPGLFVGEREGFFAAIGNSGRTNHVLKLPRRLGKRSLRRPWQREWKGRPVRARTAIYQQIVAALGALTAAVASAEISAEEGAAVAGILEERIAAEQIRERPRSGGCRDWKRRSRGSFPIALRIG